MTSCPMFVFSICSTSFSACFSQFVPLSSFTNQLILQAVIKLKDLTLKEGDKLKIPLPGKVASKREGSSRPLQSFGSFGILSPPPAPGSTVFTSATSNDGPLPTIPASPRSDSVDVDEEWGEFS